MPDLHRRPRGRRGPGRVNPFVNLEGTSPMRALHSVGGAALVILLLAGPAGAQDMDPAKIVGPEECVECHEEAVGVWEETEHQANYRTFHRSDSAQAILERMGERSARRAVCTNCHYTETEERGRTRTIAGVSCESCHGAAADWIDVHNNYGTTAGGDRATKETETAEHRQMRLQQTAEAGMIRPDQPYDLVENCFQCHTTPQEELVNTGGHPAGSDFRIVERLDQIRHNFTASGGETNRGAARNFDPTNRNRLFYVLGELVDLEYALRGLAQASGPGDYATGMTERAQAAIEGLQSIVQAAPAASGTIQPALDAATGADLSPGNQGLVPAADQVQSAARQLASQHDGSQLGGLDSMIGG